MLVIGSSLFVQMVGSSPAFSSNATIPPKGNNQDITYRAHPTLVTILEAVIRTSVKKHLRHFHYPPPTLKPLSPSSEMSLHAKRWLRSRWCMCACLGMESNVKIKRGHTFLIDFYQNLCGWRGLLEREMKGRKF